MISRDQLEELHELMNREERIRSTLKSIKEEISVQSYSWVLAADVMRSLGLEDRFNEQVVMCARSTLEDELTTVRQKLRDGGVEV